MVNSLLVTQFVTTYNILYHYMNRNIPYYTINTAFVLFLWAYSWCHLQSVYLKKTSSMYLLKKKMYSALWTEIFLRGFCKNQSEYQSDPEINFFVHLFKKKQAEDVFMAKPHFSISE